jgi:hypothetical protein
MAQLDRSGVNSGRWLAKFGIVRIAEEIVSGNWGAVARAMQERMDRLGMTVDMLIEKSGVKRSTVRELLSNRVQRRRRASTLAKLSVALGWAPGHLMMIAKGMTSTDPAQDTGPTTLEHNLSNLLERQVGDRLDVLLKETVSMRKELGTFMHRFGDPGPHDHLRRHRP